jgi:AcrR family transcriptional regulator
VDPEIVRAAIVEAEASGRPVRDLSLDAIARRAAISRSTLFRRIGSRPALEAAVRAAGVDPGESASVRERAIVAARDLIVRGGIAALTVEEVARQVGCATTSIHTQFAGRAGLLTEVFERYAPLPAVEQLINAPDWPPPGEFRVAVHAVYTRIFDTFEADLGVLEAMLSEALSKPDGLVMQLAREQFLPRIARTVGRWLMAEIAAGRCSPLHPTVLLPLLIAPIGLHLVARKRLLAAGAPVPDRGAVIDSLTDAFCRAVATTTERNDS